MSHTRLSRKTGFQRQLALVAAALTAGSLGCQSPYHADRGAAFGGLTGAGVGAIVGDAVGDAGAGAVIGAGVGALTGAAVGSSLDEIEARNRAQIAAQMGAAIRPGAASIADVVNMTHAGVSENLIATHVEHNGVAGPLTSQDIIQLKQQGVADGVISAMQRAAASPPRVAAVPAAQPVVIEEHHYGPPPVGFYYHHRRRYPHYHYRRHHHHGPRTSFGFSVSR